MAGRQTVWRLVLAGLEVDLSKVFRLGIWRDGKVFGESFSTRSFEPTIGWSESFPRSAKDEPRLEILMTRRLEAKVKKL